MKIGPYAERIKTVRRHFAWQMGLEKLSQVKFGRLVGVNPSTISHIEAGTTKIGIDLAKLLEEKTGFRQAWLLTGERPQRIREDGVFPDSAPEHTEDVSRTVPSGPGRFGFAYVKKVQPRLSSGSGELAVEEEAEDVYAFRNDWLYSKGSIPAMRLAQVSGDSMLPTLHDKDLVLFDTSKQTPQDGKIMVVGIDDLLYIKRVRVSPDGIFLVSDNKDVYKPWRVDPDNIRFLGLAIWHCGEV